MRAQLDRIEELLKQLAKRRDDKMEQRRSALARQPTEVIDPAEFFDD